MKVRHNCLARQPTATFSFFKPNCFLLTSYWFVCCSFFAAIVTTVATTTTTPVAAKMVVVTIAATTPAKIQDPITAETNYT